MDREFERFRGRPTDPAAKRHHITISNKGVIAFNKNLFNEIGKPEAVFLNFSRARSIIVLEPATPTFNESFPIKTATYGRRYICAMPFCRHFNMDIEGTINSSTPTSATAAYI